MRLPPARRGDHFFASPFAAAVTVALDPLPLTVKTPASELDQLTAASDITRPS